MPTRPGPVSRPTLATPRLEIILDLDQTDPPWIVQTINADMVRAERTARKHGWGSIQESPIAQLTVLAWAACRRNHLIPDTMDYETFETRCAGITPVRDPAEAEAEAAPTRPDPGSG